MGELGARGQHPCYVLGFSDKYMMLYSDRVRFADGRGGVSCVPRELSDHDFYKFTEGGCRYCNGQFDQEVPSFLGRWVKPVKTVGTANSRNLGGRIVQTKLSGWRVQKWVHGRHRGKVYSNVREASPDTIYRCCLEEVS